ncbi:MAG: helix-turn-helix domain-containing protein [Labilibaculum antarcticum]
MNIVLTSGIILSFFQFILLLNKRNKSLPDRILAIGICTVGIHLLSYHIYTLGYWNIYPHLIGIAVPFPLIYGPVIYLYTLYSLRKDSALQKKDYLHFAPVIFSYLYMFKFFFFYSGFEKLRVINGEVDDFSIFTSILLVLYVISGFTYTILAYLKLKTHQRLIDDSLSYSELLSLSWLKYSIWGIGLVFLAISIVVSLREGLGFEFPFNADIIFYTLIVVLVFCIGFFGIQHQNLFSNVSESAQKVMIQAQLSGEYKKSGLRQDVAESIHKKLLKLMVEEKPYLNPILTLLDLAQMMDVSTNYLSQTINQYEKVNFHDFVNQYRVDEFINRAKSNNNFSILANALDSGFNSKSSFNIVFKKFKETTPSKYLASLKK